MSSLVFVTPSYRGDINRFALLRRTIAKFYSGDAQHIVLVPKEDFALFSRRFTENRLTVLCQNDFVSNIYFSSRFYKIIKATIPHRAYLLKRWAGRPGWITQQIVKLAVPQYVHEDTVVILDSDILFLRPFTDSEFVRDNGFLLLRQNPKDENSFHRDHVKRSRHLLGLPSGATNFHYMAFPAIFQTQWIKSLQEYLEEKYSLAWQEVLYTQGILSEYNLYGVFVEEIFQPPDLIVRTNRFHTGIWDLEDFTRISQILRDASNSHIEAGPLTLVIQSNNGIEPAAYKEEIISCLGL